MERKKIGLPEILVVIAVVGIIIGIVGGIMNPPSPRYWVEREAKVVETEYLPAHKEMHQAVNTGVYGIIWGTREVPDQWKIVVRIDEQSFTLFVSKKIFEKARKEGGLTVQCLMDEKRIYEIKID